MSSAAAEDDRRAILDAERAVNEQYLRRIDATLRRHPDVVKQIAAARNGLWTGSSETRSSLDPRTQTALIGRVALEKGHPFADVLGDTFYVGAWRFERGRTGDVETVNWAAPIAELFFRGRTSNVEIASSVIGRRTFVPRLTDLVNYDDEIEPGAAPFASAGQELRIPVARSAASAIGRGITTRAGTRGSCSGPARRRSRRR